MPSSKSAAGALLILAVALPAVASCGRTNPAIEGASVSAVAASTTPSTRAPSELYSLEATACRVVEDCERVPLRDKSEIDGGACCSVCAGYAAVNHAYQARQPVCDALKRGSCPVSCLEGRPPPLACEAGRCVLTYPPLRSACARDSDCVVVPSLLPNAPPGGCRIACGHYIAGSRDWDAWTSGHWQNPSVIGVCAEGCVDPMRAAPDCVAGQCVVRAPTVVSVLRVDLRVPTATGGLSGAAVASVVAASQAQLAACKERPRSVAPIGYEGFQVHFVIGADGRATKIDPGEIAYHLPDIAACMTNVIRGLQFPLPAGGGAVEVEYPMGAAFETK